MSPAPVTEDQPAQTGGGTRAAPVPVAMSLELHDKRSRLDDFLTNNNNDGSLDGLARVTHVLCCPACPFMSLQESALAEHTASCTSSSSSSGGGTVLVHRCCLCLGASTQLGLMREHMAIYHGICKLVEADQQLTSTRISSSSRTVETAGAPTPTGSRKRKSHVPERIHSLPSDSHDLAAKMPKVQLETALSDKDCAFKAAGAASPQPPVAVASSAHGSPSSTSPVSACGILDLSLKRLADSCSQIAGLSKAQPQPHKLPKQRSSQPEAEQLSRSGSKPQRQNFSDSQNSQLQHWFSQHRDKPYPSTADTRLLAGQTGLNYSQVKKWFANRRMRTKTPGSAGLPTTGDGLCGELPISELSSGKLSPSNWSVTDCRSENSPPA